MFIIINLGYHKNMIHGWIHNHDDQNIKKKLARRPVCYGLKTPGTCFGLQIDHPGECTSGFYQLGGRTFLRDLSSGKDDDLIRILDSPHAVGDEYDRLLGHQSGKGRLHLALGFRIQ